MACTTGYFLRRPRSVSLLLLHLLVGSQLFLYFFCICGSGLCRTGKHPINMVILKAYVY